MKKIFILTGEPSGDLHAAKLLPYFLKKSIVIKAVGGEHIRSYGIPIVKDIKELAFMGITDVLKNLNKIRKNLSFIKKEILEFRPDMILLIDYPGFNLKIAKFAKENNFDVAYYITPKIWAWNQKRAYKIKKYVDHIITIFPFEKAFYKKFDIETEYFGHPIIEGLNPKVTESEFSDLFLTNNIVGLLPGSRKSEIKTLLPSLFETARVYKEKGFKFALSKVSNLDLELYNIPEDLKHDIILIEDDPYSIMKYSQALVVASGTANLEAACFHTPMVVVYITSGLTYFLGKRLIKIDHVSPVNIVNGSEIVKELIQHECTSPNILKELDYIFENYEEKVHQLEHMHGMLDQKNVSENVANYLISNLNSNSK